MQISVSKWKETILSKIKQFFRKSHLLFLFWKRPVYFETYLVFSVSCRPIWHLWLPWGYFIQYIWLFASFWHQNSNAKTLFSTISRHLSVPAICSTAMNFYCEILMLDSLPFFVYLWKPTIKGWWNAALKNEMIQYHCKLMYKWCRR